MLNGTLKNERIRWSRCACERGRLVCLIRRQRLAASGFQRRLVVKLSEKGIERFLAVIRVLFQTERGLDAAAHAGSAKQEARWKSLSRSPRRTTTRFCSISMEC